MKTRHFLIILYLAVSFISMDAFAGDTWQRNLFWGVDYLYRTKTNPNLRIHVLKVDLKAKGVRPFVTPQKNDVITGTFLSRFKVQAAINTAFFDIGNTRKPYGVFISNGTKYTWAIPQSSRTTVGFSRANEFLTGASSIP